jgi:hypothetical protein
MSARARRRPRTQGPGFQLGSSLALSRRTAAVRQILRPHPDSRTGPVVSLTVEAGRPTCGTLELRYVLTGAVEALLLPPAAASARADDLWRHSCFEAFVRAPPAQAYFEFNFAPSRAWAAYRFDAYRAGMSAPAGLAPPRTQSHATDDAFELAVSLDLGSLAELPAGAPWRLGLSAVIEQADGAKSYWALAHPPGKPDFHHAAGFVLDLDASETA